MLSKLKQHCISQFSPQVCFADANVFMGGQ